MAYVLCHFLPSASYRSLHTFLLLVTLRFHISSSQASDLGLSFDKVTKGYTIDVLIDRSVPEVMPCNGQQRGCLTSTGSEQTLEHIMEAFKKASEIMHVATRHHSHIGKVRFLLPDSWPRDNLPGALQCRTATEKPRTAIDLYHSPEASCTDASVVNDNKCGEQASEPMRLPLASIGRYSAHRCPSPAKILVHEFAHLQWGVKDEYEVDQESGVRVPKCPRQAATKKRRQIASLMANLKKSVSLMLSYVRYECLETYQDTHAVYISHDNVH